MTETPLENNLLDEAEVFHAADAWQVDGFSVWDAVTAEIAAEAVKPAPVRADALGRALYETRLPPETNDPTVALLALVRDLQNEVALLRRDVETLRRQQAGRHFPPRPIAPPLRRTDAPPLFPLTTPGD